MERGKNFYNYLPIGRIRLLIVVRCEKQFCGALSPSLCRTRPPSAKTSSINRPHRSAPATHWTSPHGGFGISCFAKVMYPLSQKSLVDNPLRPWKKPGIIIHPHVATNLKQTPWLMSKDMPLAFPHHGTPAPFVYLYVLWNFKLLSFISLEIHCVSAAAASLPSFFFLPSCWLPSLT